LIIEREEALRAKRLLRQGRKLNLQIDTNIESGPSFTSYNVIGEIRGTEAPEEIVVVGAHLDSIDFGSGALDNGSNAVMLLDVARQVNALGLKPRRTIRCALWNGEEQGMYGSAGYTQTHKDELDNHVMAASFDLGTGKINGFFVNGPQEFIGKLDAVLKPVADLGPYSHVNEPVFGTDNFDFMIFGVPNLVANQEASNHVSNYHAESDTFDKVDQKQLKLNSAVIAAVTWGFANGEVTWRRRPCSAVRDMVNETDLDDRMKGLGVWNAWLAGERGCGAD
jgi:Zn-dependent M28 family amino/carboxypeptidase